MRLWVDIESRSRVPIRHGNVKYSTAVEIIMLQYAVDDGPITVIDMMSSETVEKQKLVIFKSAVVRATEIWAHQAEFDRTMLETTNWWKALRIHETKWRCTAALARMHGLPGGLDPVFLSVLAIGVGALTFFAARMAAAPLNDLSRAASALGGDLNRLPLVERGPREVRDALRAFNAMQTKLRDHVIDRTHILASITHDLQTPLTRLRLKLERVEDIALRSRLIDDLNRMQALVRQGLDFSRGNQAEEPFVLLVLDSLLESVVHDAAEGGCAVTLVKHSGYDVEARPQALQRCLANLLENAVNHGGSAEVSATQLSGEVHVRIRDHGPGIPPDQLEAVFEPFVRLGSASSGRAGGVGLGLTIARQLAQKNDAELLLTNHPAGGLEACLILRRGVVPSAPSPDVANLTPA